MFRACTPSHRLLLTASLFGLLAVSTGCVTQSAVIDTDPVVDSVSSPNEELRRLPPPVSKTTVSVYDLEDLTGQFKERDNVQSLSKAVTQGGAAILVKALQDAGERRWFTVLERKELDNLLKERQIVTEMRRLYQQEEKIDPKVLPPLLHAGMIIEGGIIGYDTNTITGGAGARFLAIGADAKYVQDVVTVTLRAVSVKTGEVLTSVTTRKSVASYALQGGAFRYVKLDELFEAEAGTTYNEPKQIAVQSAVERAVASLIVEGAELNLWHFANPAAGAEVIAEYHRAKYGSKLTAEAVYPPSPDTQGPIEIASTVPKETELPSQAVQRIAPQRRSPAQSRRVVVPAPAQPAVRRAVMPSGQSSMPSVRQVPVAPRTVGPASGSTEGRSQSATPTAQPVPQDATSTGPIREPQERVLPPAPSVNEPAIGSTTPNPERKTLMSMLFGPRKGATASPAASIDDHWSGYR